MAATNGSPSKSLTPKQAAAVLIVRGGRPRDVAARECDLTVQEVDAAMNLADSNRNGRATPPQLAKPQTPKASEIEALLAWAESSGVQRATTLAARARGIVAELRDIEAKGEKRRTLTRTIAVLERQLAATKGELRGLDRKGAPAAQASESQAYPTREERDRIRAWARANGQVVGEKGRIADSVVAAYRAARAA